MPTVSVIATVLNESETIGGLLASMQMQTLAPDDIVIVDGGSTDGTWEQLVAAQATMPNLLPIRDETCNRKHVIGPIARGRNVAITSARGDLIACADAGCLYDSTWVDHITAPLRSGTADYTLGGSRLDLAQSTVWDIASAPFLGVKLAPTEPSKSCAARSVAFTRSAWARVGGFPESLFHADDVLFDQQMRAVARTVPADNAKAIYIPHHTFSTAVWQVSSYSRGDGIAGLRFARLMRNVLRCVAEVAALALLPLTIWPFLLVLALEIYFAYRLDWKHVRSLGPRVLLARLAFSLVVPWVVAINQVRGALRKQYQTNRQNA
ncbi:glycosyltransferase [Terriglobus aquaticus]|uniref:Glycosyltransferase n=1 Tax=Terriglobus aquaticus TaxID=940139 RepID=A0ABW9KQV3_9BACT|nr:glycosyltransferase [Terriglobus aquaticus]